MKKRYTILINVLFIFFITCIFYCESFAQETQIAHHSLLAQKMQIEEKYKQKIEEALFELLGENSKFIVDVEVDLDFAPVVHRETVYQPKGQIPFEDQQKKELEKVSAILNEMLLDVEKAFHDKDMLKYKDVQRRDIELRKIAEGFNKLQIERIRNGASKTRLSILFYAIVGNAMMLSKQNLKLIEIFAETFGDLKTKVEFDTD